jgi:hypothetical protein
MQWFQIPCYYFQGDIAAMEKSQNSHLATKCGSIFVTNRTIKWCEVMFFFPFSNQNKHKNERHDEIN